MGHAPLGSEAGRTCDGVGHRGGDDARLDDGDADVEAPEFLHEGSKGRRGIHIGSRWSLTSLQQRLVKTGGRLVKHARYYWLLPAESHLARRLFGSTSCRFSLSCDSPEEAISRHCPALGRAFLINSSIRVRRPVYTVGRRET